MKAKIREFHALMARQGIMHQKENLLAGYGVESTKELTCEQLCELVETLKNNDRNKQLKDHQWALFDVKNTQHMYLLSMCREYGWISVDTKNNRQVADLNRLGRWLKFRSAPKKPLRQLSRKELQTVIYQFEQMVKKHFSNTL